MEENEKLNEEGGEEEGEGEPEVEAGLMGYIHRFGARLNHKNLMLRRKIHKIVKTQFFYWLVIVLVFINTIVLASEYHRQPKWMEEFQRKL